MEDKIENKNYNNNKQLAKLELKRTDDKDDKLAIRKKLRSNLTRKTVTSKDNDNNTPKMRHVEIECCITLCNIQ
jgi:hypothetical protein